MRLFVEDLSGNRFIVDVESNAFVSDLKSAIRNVLNLDLSHDFRLVFNNIYLEDAKTLNFYCIIRESTVSMAVTHGGGYSLKLNDVLSAISDSIPDSDRIVLETENGDNYVSFKPITKPEDITFYDEVTKQMYHHGINEEDKEWIRQYTGSGYKKLKVQSYILKPDKEHLSFLKGLYSACWASYQTNLPSTVYHICTVTEESFSWYETDMIFYTPAFISTSKRDNLKWPGNCKWEITLIKNNRHHAVDVKDWSQYRDEEEVLLSCCTRFKVLSKHKNHKGFPYYVYLEFLDK